MTAKCPKNMDHKQFQATAHVMEEWLVDENGEFIEVLETGLEVIHWPTPEDLWFCNDCGEEAIFIPTIN